MPIPLASTLESPAGTSDRSFLLHEAVDPPHLSCRRTLNRLSPSPRSSCAPISEWIGTPSPSLFPAPYPRSPRLCEAQAEAPARHVDPVSVRVRRVSVGSGISRPAVPSDLPASPGTRTATTDPTLLDQETDDPKRRPGHSLMGGPGRSKVFRSTTFWRLATELLGCGCTGHSPARSARRSLGGTGRQQ